MSVDEGRQVELEGLGPAGYSVVGIRESLCFPMVVREAQCSGLHYRGLLFPESVLYSKDVFFVGTQFKDVLRG